MADITSRSWFCTFNNPQEHGYIGTPEEICERLKNEWIEKHPNGSGAWAYCIKTYTDEDEKDESGCIKPPLHHIHMVLEDEKYMRFSAVKNSYCYGMHFDPTKGNKKQADDYINKRGKWQEKNETIECIIYHGEIKGRQGSRSDLHAIYEKIEEGYTPLEILEMNPCNYNKESIIKKMYFNKRWKETPLHRELQVIWHVGDTGSGKTYEHLNLVKKYGEESVYFVSSYNNGTFDDYQGQRVLWLDDFRGNCVAYSDLLRLLDCYRQRIPARYCNVMALWDEVHITSVLTPQMCYPNVCKDSNDSIRQLLRRISLLVYHYCHDGQYRQLYFSPFELYNNILNEVYEQKKRYDYLKSSFDGLDSFEPIGECFVIGG